jgi:hypothetical protein
VSMRRKSITAVVAIFVLSCLQGTAWAPRVHGLPNYEGPCSVDGTSGTFTGAIFVRDYEVQDEEVIALLSITGSCNVDGTEIAMNDAQTASSLTIEKSNCSKLTLRLGAAESGDVTVDLSTAAMKSKATTDDRSAFCELARVVRSAPTAPELADALSVFFF